MQTMAEWSIDVGIIAEPYLVPRDRYGWAGDNDGSVAIIVRRNDAKGPIIPFTVVGREGVVAKWGEIVIIGIYFSPNKSIDSHV